MEPELWFELPISMKLSRYKISKSGDVKITKTGKLMSRINKGKNNEAIRLTNDESQTNQYHISRLLASTFIPNPENKPTVRCINRVLPKNNVSNLEWATMKEQSIHKHHPDTNDGLARKIRMISYDKIIIKQWRSIGDVKLELGLNDITKYLSGELKYRLYTLEYDDLDVLSGETFVEITLNSIIVFVSNLGRIQRGNYGITYGCLTDKGYLNITINDKTYLVHRIVAYVFCEIPDHLKHLSYENLEVNHLDHGTRDNSAINLNWCTPSENVQHSYDNNPDNGSMREVTQYDLQGKEIANFKSIAAANRSLNLDPNDSGVGRCCRGCIKSTHNFVWRFGDDQFEYEASFASSPKAVLQIDNTNKIVAEFVSIIEASDKTKSAVTGISQCCNGKQNTCNGFFWRFKDILAIHTNQSNIINLSGAKPIVQINIDTRKIIAEFPSITEASRRTGTEKTGLGRCCNGRQKTSNGFIWQYKINTPVNNDILPNVIG